MIDLALLSEEALGFPKLVRLSPDSLALFLDTEQWITDHRQWLNSSNPPDDVPTEADFDEIDALTAKGLKELMVDNLLIGTVFPLLTDSIPAGALECDGTAYPRTDYPALYALLASPYIVDADHFVTPDLRGRTIVGAGAGPGLSTYASGDTGGEETHQLTTGEMPAHSHGVTDPSHTHSEGNALPNATTVGPGAPQPTAIPGIGATGPAFTGISINASGGDGAHENRQPYYALRYAVWAN